MGLTADALNSYSHVLPTGFFAKISETLGIPIEKTKYTMMTAIPAVLSEVQKKIRGPEGLQTIATAIRENGFDNPAGLTSEVSNINSHINKGRDTLNRILLPGQTDSLIGKVTIAAGVNTSQGAKLLAAASTAVFTFIGSQMKGGNLAPAAFNHIPGHDNVTASASQFATANEVAFTATVQTKPSTLTRFWPWVLLAIAIGIIWYTQGRNAAPLLAP
jgi:hypothetical protein